jgi:FHA domain/Domain of unknown function (DUF1707)
MPRASDETREQTVAVLRDGLATGRLGMTTFVRRVDDAYDAKTRDELARLTADLPPAPSWRERLVSLLGYGVEVEEPALPLRPPPVETGAALVIGRDASCDYAVWDSTVSARHALLRRERDGWSITDCGSRNGTRVNGWRVARQELADGDEVALGASRFVFREPRG